MGVHHFWGDPYLQHTVLFDSDVLLSCADVHSTAKGHTEKKL